MDRPLVAIIHPSTTESPDTRLRRRLQAASARRLYRLKYHAAKTLAAFDAPLRTETHLSGPSNRRLTAMRETMQPASVPLWLRPAQRAGTAVPGDQAPRSLRGGWG